MTSFWIWSASRQVWVRADEYMIQASDLPTRRSIFQRWGYCTAVEKAVSA